jgi:ssDNA-binding Zn-finger/Zn-ribbon topoisomerase 1
MSIVITERIELTVISCANCHIHFAMPSELAERRRREGGNFYCPNGHVNVYRETELDRLKRQVLQEKAAREQAEARARDERLRANRFQESAKAADRPAAATRGVVTRMKNRVANGVCPCCNRHFVNLERHMKGQHPEWKPEEVKP